MSKITKKDFERVCNALSDWVIEYHQDDNDKFVPCCTDFDFTSIYYDGPYEGDEDEDGNAEVDENLILYVLNVDIYLADRIKYIKEYKIAHPDAEIIPFDEDRFPSKFTDYDTVSAWYRVDTEDVDLVFPSIDLKGNEQLVKNMKAFLDEFWAGTY